MPPSTVRVTPAEDSIPRTATPLAAHTLQYVSSRASAKRLVRAKFPYGPRFRDAAKERAFRKHFADRMNAGKGGAVHLLAATEIFIVSFVPAPFFGEPRVRLLMLLLWVTALLAVGLYYLTRHARRGWTFWRAQVANVAAASLYSYSLMIGAALLLPRASSADESGGTDYMGTDYIWNLSIMSGFMLWPLTLATTFSLKWEAYCGGCLLYYAMKAALILHRRPGGGGTAELVGVMTFALLYQVLAATIAWNNEITRRVRFATLERLAADKARLQEKLVDWLQRANAPCFAVNTALHITAWNHKIAELTGVTADVALAGGVRLPDIVPAARRESTERVLRNAAKGHATDAFELVVTSGWHPGLGTRGRPTVTLLMNATAHDDDDDDEGAPGISQKVVGVGQDITAHVRMDQARKSFLASFSHELRTPLNGLLGMLELLHQMQRDLPPRAAHFVSRAALSGNLLLNLINDILDLSRIEQGEFEISETVVHMPEAVAEATELVAPQIESKGLRLRVELDRATVPEYALVDALRLRQVLLNLLSNAVKFTMEGSISVKCRGESCERRNSSAGSGGHSDATKLIFEVQDSGVGLRPRDAARLFEGKAGEFTKIEEHGIDNPTGCGLGLNICKMLVGLMGGEISVVSEYGRGSTFCFSIRVRMPPAEVAGQAGDARDSGTGTRSGDSDSASTGKVSDDQLLSARRSSGLSQHSLAGMRALLAEDNSFNAEVLTTFLQQLGFTVEWAANGQAAANAFVQALGKSEPFDVVFMDCNMPVVDGYRATAMIREHEIGQVQVDADALLDGTHEAAEAALHTPIIALTAYAMKEDRRRCLAAGMDAFLTKPVSKKRLLRAVLTTFGQLRANGKVSSATSSGGTKSKTSSTLSGSRRLVARPGISDHDGSDSGIMNSLVENLDEVQTRDMLVGSFETTAPQSLAASVRCRVDATKPAMPEQSLSSPPLRFSSAEDAAADEIHEHLSSEEAALMKLSAAPIDAQLGLAQFGGNHAVWQRMLGKFATDYLPRGIATICAAQERWDIVVLRMEAHSLKGSCGFVGAAQLADLCARLMATCGLDGELREWQKRFIMQVVAQVEAEYQILNAYFEQEHDFSLDPVHAVKRQGTAPAPAPARLRGQGRATTPEEKVRGARILLAEDNPFTADVLCSLLSGARVTVVDDGAAAVAAYVAEPAGFDVIIMDYLLPIVDGAAATRQVRAAEAEARAGAVAKGEGEACDTHVPIVGLTSNTLHKQKALESGMDAFATKPISRHELLTIVAKALPASRLQGRRAGADDEAGGDARGHAGGGSGGGDGDGGGGGDGSSRPGSKGSGSAAHAGLQAALFAALQGTPGVVDVRQGLQNFGDSAVTLVQYLERFAAGELNASVEAIHQGQEDADAAKLHQAAHGLKASSGMVGAVSLQRACRALQQACPRPGEAGVAGSPPPDSQLTTSAEVLVAVQEVDDAVADFRSFMARWVHTRRDATRRGGAGAGVPNAGGADQAAGTCRVAVWLERHGMASLAPAFSDAEVETLDDLLFMARSGPGRFEQDLKEIGVSLGKRRKIEKLLQQHQHQHQQGT